MSAALDATGVTAWAGQQLIAAAGESRTRLIVLTMLLVAGLTALISVNGSVAALMPVVVLTGDPPWPAHRRSCCSRSPSAPTRARCSR